MLVESGGLQTIKTAYWSERSGTAAKSLPAWWKGQGHLRLYLVFFELRELFYREKWQSHASASDCLAVKWGSWHINHKTISVSTFEALSLLQEEVAQLQNRATDIVLDTNIVYSHG